MSTPAKTPLSTPSVPTRGTREKHNRYDGSSPGFPERRQFYWRKLRLFDLLFFPVDSLWRGAAAWEGNFRINCAKRLSRSTALESLRFALSTVGDPLRETEKGGERGRKRASGLALLFRRGGRARSKFRVWPRARLSSGLATSRMALRLYQRCSRCAIHVEIRHSS